MRLQADVFLTIIFYNPNLEYRQFKIPYKILLIMFILVCVCIIYVTVIMGYAEVRNFIAYNTYISISYVELKMCLVFQLLNLVFLCNIYLMNQI